MWLLSTDRAELHFFAAESDVTSQGGYAILSHVWGPNEQTFQDLNTLAAQCNRTGENPRNLVCAKIRDCCILAERHGFKWVWVDTCCIDKTSSTELTEAINSMYRWYAIATVCYAYLLDVPNGDSPELVDSAFRRSRWHTRGWTLQELIAPVHVIFYSTDWHRLGDKRGLAEVLTEITGVHIDVLQGRITDLAAITVAQRMSWAAYRQTTRLEDEAYCLLGIFNITMPTLYGEGRRAFRRLQEEIMKNSVDSSLLAWGPCMTDHDMEALDAASPDTVRTVFASQPRFEQRLFAPAPIFFYQPFPIVFGHNSGVEPTLKTSRMRNFLRALKNQRKPQIDPGGFLDFPVTSMTSYGAQMHIVTIKTYGMTIAILGCLGRDDAPVGLLLHECGPNGHRSGYGFHKSNAPFSEGLSVFRLVSITAVFRHRYMKGKASKMSWKDIYFVSPQPTWNQPRRPLETSPAIPFWFPGSMVWTLGGSWPWGYDLSKYTKPRLVFYNCSCDSADHTTHLFADQGNEVLVVTVGRCTKAGAPWAYASPLADTTSPVLRCGEHLCPDHHIETSPETLDQTKVFGDSKRTIALSFRRCDLFAHETWSVDIKLGGTVYNALQTDAPAPLAGTSPTHARPKAVESGPVRRPEVIMQLASERWYASASSSRTAQPSTNGVSARDGHLSRSMVMPSISHKDLWDAVDHRAVSGVPKNLALSNDRES